MDRVVVVLIAVMMILLMSGSDTTTVSTKNKVGVGQYDIVIYGGGPQAVAAAVQAAETTQRQKRILMVVPESGLGSILTLGAQNLFDYNSFRSSYLPPGLPHGYVGAQGGSMYRFQSQVGLVFSPHTFEKYLAQTTAAHGVTVLYDTDVSQVSLQLQPGLDGDASRSTWSISHLTLSKIKKDSQGRYVFVPDSELSVRAPIFIDASESGRLVRLAAARARVLGGPEVPFTVGRQDQHVDQRQMAATLMFKVRGIDLDEVRKGYRAPFDYSYSDLGSLQIWGGYRISSQPVFEEYRRDHPAFRLKPYNAGEDGYAGVRKQDENTEFWMNMLLVYHVDGRKSWRDWVAKDGLYPTSQGLDPEVAREMAIREIARPGFIQRIRSLPGMKDVQLVLTTDGRPVTGDILYVRESIHSANSMGPTYRFALDKAGVLGDDGRYYAHRIGLGYYNLDSNTYHNRESLTNPLPARAWYVPYESLLNPALNNVLIPGYAANIDSFAWTAMRVYPNLIVLGDAAGTAAGLAAIGRFEIAQPSAEQIGMLQDTLRAYKAILEK